MPRVIPRSSGRTFSMPHARLRVAVPCVALALLAIPASASGAVIKGTPKADRLTGSASADRIEARGGRDFVKGAGGADKLYGGAAADRIVADGWDRVSAGAGADTIQLTADALSFRI